MSLFLRILGAVSALGLAIPAALAEEAQTLQEIRELRQTVQAQAKQIEALTQQIGKLAQLIGTQTVGAPVAHAAEAAAEPPREEFVPKAEVVPQAPKHIVVKGETLTSIAKHYSIALIDLQRANKIEDGRKLQIGQTLLLPPPKPSEQSSDKKHTP